MHKQDFYERMDRLAASDPKMDANFTMAGSDAVLNSLHPSIVNAPDLVPHALALEVIRDLYEHLDTHPIKTAEGFRNAALGNGMFAINPLLKIHRKPDVDFLMEVLRRTISNGQMLDFGFIPNEIIKTESLRSREDFEAEELQHPYPSWLAVSAWEGGMCGYYYAPYNASVDSKDIDGNPNRLLAVELYGVSPPNRPEAILVNDIVSIEVINHNETRIHPFTMIDGVMETEKQIQDRGANLLNPLVTFLRFLADASIPVIDQPAPEKLNRKRVLQGKFEIPAHTKVETRDYVSMITHSHSSRNAYQGGHHASPIAHPRRAHKRHLASGKVVPVRSTRVNWRDTEELHRLFYRVPKP